MIRVKRVYDPLSDDDGQRFLVERLWPRGVKRADAALSGWLKDLAPGAELRRWFDHDPARWEEFQQRYAAELQTENKQARLRELAATARHETVTLIYSARDTQHNNALTLQHILEQYDLSHS